MGCCTRIASIKKPDSLLEVAKVSLLFFLKNRSEMSRQQVAQRLHDAITASAFLLSPWGLKESPEGSGNITTLQAKEKGWRGKGACRLSLSLSLFITCLFLSHWPELVHMTIPKYKGIWDGEYFQLGAISKKKGKWTWGRQLVMSTIAIFFTTNDCNSFREKNSYREKDYRKSPTQSTILM